MISIIRFSFNIINVHQNTDEYYAGLDDWIYRWEQSAHVQVRRNPVEKMLDHLISSPIRCELVVTDAEVLKIICREYIERYIGMAEKSMENSIDGSLVSAMVERDLNLYDCCLSKLKFEFAEVMGRDFAPMAEDIALGILGPKHVE